MLTRTVCGHDIRVRKGSVRVTKTENRDRAGGVVDITMTAESLADGRRYTIMHEEIPLSDSYRFCSFHRDSLSETMSTARQFQREYA